MKNLYKGCFIFLKNGEYKQYPFRGATADQVEGWNKAFSQGEGYKLLHKNIKADRESMGLHLGW